MSTKEALNYAELRRAADENLSQEMADLESEEAELEMRKHILALKNLIVEENKKLLKVQSAKPYDPRVTYKAQVHIDLLQRELDYCETLSKLQFNRG